MPASLQDREIIIKHVIRAPREHVWAAWTDPKHISQWFGPDGFRTETELMEVRAGGRWVHTMIGPDGHRYPNVVTYTKVVKPERLAYTNTGNADLAGFHTIVTFRADGQKTNVVLHMVFASPTELEKQKKIGAIEGGEQTLRRLASLLEK